MPTELQKALEIPILVEMAISGVAVRTGHGWSELSELQDIVATYFPDATKSAKSRVLGSGGTEYYNSHQWAIKDLKLKGFLKGEPRDHFDITEAGLKHLRNALHVWLSAADESQVEEMVSARDENDRELWLNLVARIRHDDLRGILECSSSRNELFLRAVAAVDPWSFGGFLTSAYESVKPVIVDVLRSRHRI